MKQMGCIGITGGFNRRAVCGLLLGILPNVPGFLVTVGSMPPGRLPAWIVGMYGYAWFTGFLVAGGSYWLMMRAAGLTYKEEVNYVTVN